MSASLDLLIWWSWKFIEALELPTVTYMLWQFITYMLPRWRRVISDYRVIQLQGHLTTKILTKLEFLNKGCLQYFRNINIQFTYKTYQFILLCQGKNLVFLLIQYELMKHTHKEKQIMIMIKLNCSRPIDSLQSLVSSAFHC